jgi:hypothetical protein
MQVDQESVWSIGSKVTRPLVGRSRLLPFNLCSRPQLVPNTFAKYIAEADSEHGNDGRESRSNCWADCDRSTRSFTTSSFFLSESNWSALKATTALKADWTVTFERVRPSNTVARPRFSTFQTTTDDLSTNWADQSKCLIVLSSSQAPRSSPSATLPLCASPNHQLPHNHRLLPE